MLLIATTLLNHLELTSSFNEITSVFKIFTLFCENDYGFLVLKQCVQEKAPNTIYSMLCKIQKSIKSCDAKDETLQSVVCSLIEMLRWFVFDKNNDAPSQRTFKLTNSEIVALFKWKPIEQKGLEEVSFSNTLNQEVISKEEEKEDKELKLSKKEQVKLEKENVEAQAKLESKDVYSNLEKDDRMEIDSTESEHCLITISKYIDTISKEENLDLIKQSMDLLVSFLSNCEDETSESSGQEIHLPPLEPFPLQFSKRQVYIVIKNVDNEKLNPRFWLSLPTYFDQDRNNQLMFDGIKINFIEMSKKYISADFNIRKALQEIYNYQDSSEMISNNKVENRKLDPIINTKESKSFASVKKTFVAPMRGRGYTRPGGVIHSTRANDPFRSRPPNTSRPPSMHVDDFVALEQSTTSCNNFENNVKRTVKDFANKPRNVTVNNPSSRSFGSTCSLVPTSTSSYYSESYLNRRNVNNPTFSHLHQSPSRSNGPNSSSRTTFTRYSRENYSPSNSRPVRSGSIGSSTSSQHWVKTAPIVRRESRDSRTNRTFTR